MILLDNGVSENFASDLVDLLLGGFLCCLVADFDFEILALSYIEDVLVAESVQRGTDGAALGIKDRLFESDVDKLPA